MLDFLIPISCGLIGAAFTLVPAIIKDKDPLKSCVGFIFLTIILGIGAGLGFHNISYNVQVPIDQPLNLVTPSQVLTKGSKLNGDLKHAYLATDKASKAIDKVETKGSGTTVTDITYSVRHTDSKWFGLTDKRDAEKRQTIATVHLDDATDKTLKHFFN